jgi:hypothetical protein
MNLLEKYTVTVDKQLIDKMLVANLKINLIRIHSFLYKKRLCLSEKHCFFKKVINIRVKYKNGSLKTMMEYDK